ncbi:TPA: hypothetical protein NJU31_003621, partial [Acinetobacter baumannii]|nr:hypothetical protein [Acinetobacter baumannii]
IEAIDNLLSLNEINKIHKNIRVCYQTEVTINFLRQTLKVYPYTFEEAIYFENREVLKNNFTTEKNSIENKVKATGVLYKMLDAEENTNFFDYRRDVFSALDSNKVDMAMDLIYGLDPKILQTPKYIEEGLIWLENEILGGKSIEEENKLIGEEDAA